MGAVLVGWLSDSSNFFPYNSWLCYYSHISLVFLVRKPKASSKIQPFRTRFCLIPSSWWAKHPCLFLECFNLWLQIPRLVPFLPCWFINMLSKAEQDVSARLFFHLAAHSLASVHNNYKSSSHNQNDVELTAPPILSDFHLPMWSMRRASSKCCKKSGRVC